MTEFAKAQLLKYGWTEGKGLGKNENGISEALKPKLKFNKSGIGLKDLDNNWWDSIYDKAVKNISFNKIEDNSINNIKENFLIAIPLKEKKKVNSQIKKSKKKHNLYYGRFLKTFTLENGNMIKDSTCESIPDDNKESSTVVKMSDEELFEACGSRTVHKGARHGLRLNGKLARIAEQEKQFIAASFLKSNEQNCCEIKQKKEKKRKKCMEVEDCISVLNNDHILDDINCQDIPLQLENKVNYKPSKKARLKVKRKIQCLTDQLSKSCIIQDDSVEDSKLTKNKLKNVNKNKKKSKHKLKQEALKNIQNNEIDFNSDVHMQPHTKKSKVINDEISNVNKINEDFECSELFQTKNKNNRNQNSSNKVKDCKYKHDKLTEADRKNIKIKLKKTKKFKRKEKEKLNKLSKSILAFSLNDHVQDNTTKKL